MVSWSEKKKKKKKERRCTQAASRQAMQLQKEASRNAPGAQGQTGGIGVKKGSKERCEAAASSSHVRHGFTGPVHLDGGEEQSWGGKICPRSGLATMHTTPGDTRL